MSNRSKPTVSAVLAAYASEDWIGEALDSIVGQTSPPDEIVVVDDGSPDRTAEIIESYGDRVRLIRQENTGYPVAMNRAIREATGDFVAPCGADDIWEPQKLEWQREAIRAHPEVGVHFGHAVFFGTVESDHERPTGTGILDRDELLSDLLRINPINMPSAVIGRALFGPLGWFRDGFLADDFEFFFRCLRAEIDFYYDPRPLVRYRRHEHNITRNNAALREAMHVVHKLNADLLGDPDRVARVMAGDLFEIGRAYADEGDRVRARRAIRRSLRYTNGNGLYETVRALAWVACLGLPAGASELAVRALLGMREGALGSLTPRDPSIS
jgi:glycosyltransferase involved in cell wall biosynthesis